MKKSVKLSTFDFENLEIIEKDLDLVDCSIFYSEQEMDDLYLVDGYDQCIDTTGLNFTYWVI